MLVRMGQGVGAVCVGMGVFVTLALNAPMGPALTAVAVVWVAMYSVVVQFWAHPWIAPMRRWGASDLRGHDTGHHRVRDEPSAGP